MVRDGLANIVIRLQESGFDPRRIGPDSWESCCPAHRSADCALSIIRIEHDRVLLESRSAENCQHIRVIRALGITNEHLYAETADGLISRLSPVPIQPASFVSADANGKNGAGTSADEGANGLAVTWLRADGGPSAEAVSSPNTAVQPPSAPTAWNFHWFGAERRRPNRQLKNGRRHRGPANDRYAEVTKNRGSSARSE